MVDASMWRSAPACTCVKLLNKMQPTHSWHEMALVDAQAAARQDVDSDSEDARSVQRSARSTSSTPTCETTSPFAAYAGGDPAAPQSVQPSSTAAPEPALPPRAFSATLPTSRLKASIQSPLHLSDSASSTACCSSHTHAASINRCELSFSSLRHSSDCIINMKAALQHAEYVR